ncbi:Kazal-type serine protease inhibitor family protein [Bradyrhizobium liaoningense]|uniref:Kazal-type serine protease inhibitor family protein n=1 Tax=Bradyrhizobium liaoningense TaxID=43992 RepID=UPI0009D9DB34
MRASALLGIFLLSCSVEVSAVEVKKNGKSVDAPVCGGFLGIQCNPIQWCHYPEGARCGLADQFGVCRPRPEACPEVYMPVCGCDGTTYGNACKAAADGWDVAYVGKCRTGEPAK